MFFERLINQLHRFLKFSATVTTVTEPKLRLLHFAFLRWVHRSSFPSSFWSLLLRFDSNPNLPLGSQIAAMSNSILLLAILTLALTCSLVNSMRFELKSGHTKCISENIQNNAMTVGKYNVVNPNEGQPIPDTHKITLKVWNSPWFNFHALVSNVCQIWVNLLFFFFAWQWMILRKRKKKHYLKSLVGNIWEPPSNFWIFIHWGRGIDSQMEMLLAVCDLFWVIITKFLNLECFTWAVKLRHWTQLWSMHTPPHGVRHLYDSHTTCVWKSDMSRKSLTSVSKKVFFSLFRH